MVQYEYTSLFRFSCYVRLVIIGATYNTRNSNNSTAASMSLWSAIVGRTSAPSRNDLAWLFLIFYCSSQLQVSYLAWQTQLHALQQEQQQQVNYDDKSTTSTVEKARVQQQREQREPKRVVVGFPADRQKRKQEEIVVQEPPLSLTFSDQAAYLENAKRVELESSDETTSPVFVPLVPDPFNKRATRAEWDKIAEFERINRRLLGNATFESNYSHICGCPGKAVAVVDCPRWYTSTAIEESCRYMDENAAILVPYAQAKLKARSLAASQACRRRQLGGGTGNAVLGSDGALCLAPKQPMKPPILSLHAPQSRRIVQELSDLIEKDKITSISEFGAGLGQYKAAILAKHPDGFEYRAYDGSGNVDSYTNGFSKYVDLTIPSALPVSDWVLFMQGGEKASSASEGMIVRNLHRNNCRGIILGWGELDQGGRGHVNNHSSAYMIAVFESLGYTYDADASAKFNDSDSFYHRYIGSLMVFRRKQPVCG